MQPRELLDEYIEQIQLGNKMYSRAKAERVYAKLTAPKTTGTFYDANRVRGTIDPDGQVSFKAYYPELDDEFTNGWSYKTPEEQGIARTSPKPMRGIIGMRNAFESHLKNPDGFIRRDGAGLYYNHPASSHRAAAYQQQGMVPVEGMNYQVLDNRRFQNNPTIAELMMRMDAEQFPSNIAATLRQPILERHPQLREVVERIHLPAALSGPSRVDDLFLDEDDLGFDRFYHLDPPDRNNLASRAMSSDEENAAFLGMTLAEYRAGNNSFSNDAPF